MKSSFLKKLCIIALGFAGCAFYMPLLSADENAPELRSDVVDMVTGDIQTIVVNNLTRVSVTNPDVADISDAQNDKVSLLAKKAGETVLFLWDAAGKRSVKVRVVSEELSEVRSHVQRLLQEANIAGVLLEENQDEGKVVLTGSLTKEDKDRMEDILQPYSDNLLNLVKVEKSEDLIQVDMQVVEISTTLEKNLGIQWVNAIGSNESTATTSGTAQSPTGLVLPYTETPPTTNGKIGDFFKIGNFNRTFQLQAQVNALLQEGKARLISKPRLVVVSGKQASFLVGGEIPIQSTTVSASGGQSQSNTTYSEYGVNMTVTPTIREKKIDVILNVDIRDIDSATPLNSSSSSNGNIAFITRTASTDLLMDNKQTIVLAGLIKYSDNDTESDVPILSKIPILGFLFRNHASGFPSADSNTEMVIILTPTVLTDKKFADKQIVMPTPSEKSAWKEIDSRYEHEPLVSSWPNGSEEQADQDPAFTAPVTMPVAAVSTPAVVPVSTVSGSMVSYARMVQEKISKAIIYPQAAMGMTPSGTVKLRLHILKNGALDSEEVMESSGSDILDKDAMQAAKTAAPFDAFTTGMDQEDMIFTIPIVYNKLISGSQVPAERASAS